MIKIGESAMLIATIGQTAHYLDRTFTIGNVAFRSTDGSFVSAESGELHYLLLENDKASYGWVVAGQVTMDSMQVQEGSNSTDEFFDQDTRSPHLEELGYSMVGWLDGLENRPDNETLPEVITLLMAIQYDKEGSYGSSWKMRGEHRSIIPNIDRKFDRLSKMTDDEMYGSRKSLMEQEQLLAKDFDLYSQEVGESKVDAVADLANYTVLYLGYIRQNFPNVFQTWVDRNIPKYLADKIPFLQKDTASIEK